MSSPRHLLVVELAERFRQETGQDISRSRAALHRLLEAVDGAVEQLQEAEAVQIDVPALAVTRRGPLGMHLKLTREDALTAANVRSVEQLLE